MESECRYTGSEIISKCHFLFVFIFCFAYSMFPSHATHAADWSFNPSVTVSEQYDSNIRLLPNDAPNKESDFITSVTPMLSLSRDTELTKFRFDTITSAQKYFENPKFDTIDTASRAFLTMQWNSRFSTDANIAFIHDTTMEDQLEQAGIRTIRAERYHYEFSAGAKYALTERLSLQFAGSGGQSIYPSGEVSDQLSSQVSLIPAWAITERDTIGLAGAFSYKDYEEGPKIYNFSEILYWQRLMSETLGFEVGVGYQFQSSDSSSTVPRFIPPNVLVPVGRAKRLTDSMPIGLGELKKDWSKRFSTTFNIGRQQYTDVDGRSFESNFVGGTAKYLITELVTFHFNARYYANREIEKGDQEIDYFALSPSVERKITENLSVALRGSYEHELTDNRGVDSNADRYRTWIELIYRWPRFLASH